MRVNEAYVRTNFRVDSPLEFLTDHLLKNQHNPGFALFRKQETTFILVEPYKKFSVSELSDSAYSDFEENLVSEIGAVHKLPPHIPWLFGYFSYESHYFFEDVERPEKLDNLSPLIEFYAYRKIYEVQGTLVTEYCRQDIESEPFGGQSESLSARKEGRYAIKNSRSNTQQKEYEEKVSFIRDEITKGNVYQVNLSRKINYEIEGSAAGMFLSIIERENVPYGSFIVSDGGKIILSFSPELFFERTGSKVRTRPIKGTAKSDSSNKNDESLGVLLASEKNLSELAMIVDVMRNDLGKIEGARSISVAKFPLTMTLQGVHHLYAEVTAEVPSETSSFEVLRTLFPSTSITGAPKRAAIDYIAKLESDPREVYCGSIGYFGGENSACFNVAIRSGIFSDGRFEYHAGGGVTIESDPTSEYIETELKTSFLI